MVFVKYKDKKGNITERVLEPYKINGNDFWGYDISKDGIRRFKIENLQNVKSAKDKFNPRWPIEL